MEKDISPAPGTTDELDARWRKVLRRRKFLYDIGASGVALSAGAMVAGRAKAQDDDAGAITKGDVAILRFLAAAEIIESDLWEQYNELGGAKGGNPAYIAALQNLDSDMPQYISDNTDDELSHAAFLNRYLESKGADPVNLKRFLNLPSSKATGAQDKPRLTNLMNLNVDTSWYTRYRSGENPDSGATFKQAVTIRNEPAIPLNDSDTPPNTPGIVPPLTGKETPQQLRMQAIANTAGFHFGFIEQGGSSLYATMALKATNLQVLRIIVSIGGVEVDHFSLWHDKAGNATAQPLAGVKDPETGLKFPDLNNPPFGGEQFQTNLILPEPCDFLFGEALPPCSVIRPTLDKFAGAVATVRAFTADVLFMGQPKEFFTFLMKLAEEADAAHREI